MGCVDLNSKRFMTFDSATGIPGFARDDLGPLLVHRKRRGENAGMGIGDFKVFQHTLDHPVLAIRTVQGIERDIGFQIAEHRANIVIDVDARHPVTFCFKHIRAGIAG